MDEDTDREDVDEFSSPGGSTETVVDIHSEINKQVNVNNSLEEEKVDSTALAQSLITNLIKEVYEVEDTDDEEDMHIQEEIEALRLQVEQQSLAKLAEVEEEEKARLRVEEQEKKERKRLRRERLEKERADLLQQSKVLQFQAPGPAPVPKINSSKNLKDKAADLAAKQQSKGAKSKLPVDGLTIAGIRALPGMTPEVENWITSLQSSIPSLAKTPTGPTTSGVSFQPPGVFTGVQAHGDIDDVDTEYIYSTSRGKLVPVLHDSPGRGISRPLNSKQVSSKQLMQQAGSTPAAMMPAVHRVVPDVDADASEDEDCPVEPAKGYKLAWYRDNQGKKYFLHKLKEDNPPEQKSYVCDEATGRWYERGAPRGAGAPGSRPASPYVDHRVTRTSPMPQVLRGVRTPAAAPPPPAKAERLPGFFQGNSEKQGRDTKMPDVVQWARNCPVNWTTKVTSDKLNAVLWAWAYVSELLATRTGQAPNLQPGELEARMEHFCNVLEITLQSSNQTDFCGDAWDVARLYDQKVQQKVDNSQFSWLQLSAMNHGASQPDELMAAH